MKEELKYDTPLTNPNHDILGRRHFSHALAKSIIGLEASQGFVYALYGPWGSGKSTVINFVEHYIEEHNKIGDIETKIVIFKFNPWMFSGTENLTKVYLDQLRARLSMDDVSADLKKVSKGLELIERGLSFAAPIADYIVPASGGVLKMFGSWLSNTRAITDSASDATKSLISL